jgi:hypothetical protein
MPVSVSGVRQFEKGNDSFSIRVKQPVPMRMHHRPRAAPVFSQVGAALRFCGMLFTDTAPARCQREDF